MTASKSPERELKPFEIGLRIGDRIIAARGSMPDIPIRIADFLPVLQSLSNAISEVAEKHENEAGRRISCKAGCGACCRQAVPIAPSEAVRLAELVQALPAERRERIEQRFTEGLRILDQSGLLDEFNTLDAGCEISQRQELGLRYFRQQIACPFLENENCSIHPDRPLACREYSVTSPAKNCASPSAESVRLVRRPKQLSHLLLRLEDSHGDAPPRPLLLIQALAQTRADKLAGQPKFAPVDLIRNLISGLRSTGSPGTG